MKKKPSMTTIKKYLTSCAFDPRKPGPMAIIADSGGPEYYEQRAIELIKEAQNIMKGPPDYQNHYDDKLSSAIRLLALAHESRS